MELRHLRYFVAVAEEKHITRAAERLGIAQPPLSRQIRALEAELNIELLERVPHGVEPTRAGAAFLDEARAILASADRAVVRVSRIARGIEGALALGFTSSAVLHPLVGRAIRSFRTAYPGVALEYEEGNAAQLTEAISEGRLHAAVLRAPVAQPRGLAFHFLLKEPMLLIVPRGHRAVAGQRAGGTTVVSLRAMRDEPFILVRRPGAPGMYADLVAACGRLGFTPRIAAEVNHMFTNLALVAAGVGISAVPASMRRVHSEALVHCRLTDAPQLVAPMTLVHKDQDENPALAHFTSLVKRLARAQR